MRCMNEKIANLSEGAHWLKVSAVNQLDLPAGIYRFVVTAPYPDYEPLKTYGWNSTELLVKDVDALAERLRASPFKIVGEPRNLSTGDEIKAMQVMGPAREFLYLTTIKDPKHPLGQAASFVDRMFIVINGGRDMKDLITFYGQGMGAQVTDPIPVRMTALNKVHGFDIETRHPLATAKLNGPFMIELDQYPATVKDRVVRAGDLPPGTAMVTFAIDSFARAPTKPVAPPAHLAGKVYGAGRAQVIKGPNGEWIELVEGKERLLSLSSGRRICGMAEAESVVRVAGFFIPLVRCRPGLGFFGAGAGAGVLAGSVLAAALFQDFLPPGI